MTVADEMYRYWPDDEVIARVREQAGHFKNGPQVTDTYTVSRDEGHRRGLYTIIAVDDTPGAWVIHCHPTGSLVAGNGHCP